MGTGKMNKIWYEIVLKIGHLGDTETFVLYPSSSSIGTTAHCGLWPVEQCPSIFSYLPPTISIFSLPAPEDLFLLPLSIFSWAFLFFSSLPIFEWRSFWASYPPPFSLGDLTSLSFALLSILLYFSFVHLFSFRFVLLFHSPSPYLAPHILLNIFLSKISRAFSSFFVNVHASAPHDAIRFVSNWIKCISEAGCICVAIFRSV